jgi:prevent-host-death family protein
MRRMTEVSIRELRNHGGEVIDRVAAGERVTDTRDGRAVAELCPLGRPPVSARVLKRRWARLPALDPEVVRRDIDRVVDGSL